MPYRYPPCSCNSPEAPSMGAADPFTLSHCLCCSRNETSVFGSTYEWRITSSANQDEAYRRSPRSLLSGGKRTSANQSEASIPEESPISYEWWENNFRKSKLKRRSPRPCISHQLYTIQTQQSTHLLLEPCLTKRPSPQKKPFHSTRISQTP